MHFHKPSCSAYQVKDCLQLMPLFCHTICNNKSYCQQLSLYVYLGCVYRKYWRSSTVLHISLSLVNSLLVVWVSISADCSTRCDFVSKISKSLIALLISIHRPYMCILQKNDEYWFLTLYEETWSYECHFILGIKSSTLISTLFQITIYRVICTHLVTQVKNCLLKTFIWMCIRIKRDTRYN